MKQKLQTPFQLWDEFANLILPKNCSQVQRTETRRAFFAGMAGMRSVMLSIGDLADVIGEAACVRHLEEMDKELREFGLSIGKGDR